MESVKDRYVPVRYYGTFRDRQVTLFKERNPADNSRKKYLIQFGNTSLFFRDIEQVKQWADENLDNGIFRK